MDALQSEIALLRGLNHANIVRYIGSETTDQHLNIFLEYVPGGSVLQLLAEYGRFDEGLVRTFTRQVCSFSTSSSCLHCSFQV